MKYLWFTVILGVAAIGAMLSFDQLEFGLRNSEGQGSALWQTSAKNSEASSKKNVADSVLNDAVASAKSANKVVLVHFSADW